ncbi:MAG: hypothetical protein OXT68_04700, partial [Chloroflexota bacterium]|nr:hypothetical protein [Chloroflexota bacterium]
ANRLSGINPQNGTIRYKPQIINIPRLVEVLTKLAESGRIVAVIDEILLYSRFEFHYSVDN